MSRHFRLTLLASLSAASVRAELPPPARAFIENRCLDCHDGETKMGNLDLTALKPDVADAESFAPWLKVHDRIA